LFLWSNTWLYQGNLVVLEEKSRSSSQEPGSDSCIQLYQWTYCSLCQYIQIFKIMEIFQNILHISPSSILKPY
jgi:hypothetical protein